MKHILILPFLFFFLNSYSQDETFNVFEGKAGISFYNVGSLALGLEGGFILGKKWKKELDNFSEAHILQGASLTTQVFYSEVGFLAGPKLTYDYYQDVLGFRTGAATYFGKGITPDYRFILEGGLSLIGMVNLFLGFSLPLKFNQMSNLGIFNLSLQVNFYERHDYHFR